MKKISWILMFILGFFIVFAVSAIITFTITLDRDESSPSEVVTEPVYTGGSNLPNVIENETAVTRVTPSLSVADAIVVRTVYGDKPEENNAATYEISDAAAVDAMALDESVEEVQEKEPEVEEKKEEAKVETPKVEEKKEEAKAEAPKAEEKKEEAKAETPKAEEKVEEPKVVLDPNKQYSDTGL